MTSHYQDELFSADLQRSFHSSQTLDPYLSIQIDQRKWLRFLAEDWLTPPESGWIIFGNGCVAANTSDSSKLSVTVYVDKNALPNGIVAVFNGEHSTSARLHDPMPLGAVIAWPGPIPLSAVHHFSVESDKARAHLIGIVQSFEDLELPPQPIEINIGGATVGFPEDIDTQLQILPPSNWNALRGAAAMAVATVPSIAPWLDRLCDLFNVEQHHTEFESAPWLSPTFWSVSLRRIANHRGLWQALLETLSAPGVSDGWVPEEVLEKVCARATELCESDEIIDLLFESTRLLLQDRGTIEDLGITSDPLCAAFQMVLLRPTPERYLSWREDWRAVPPVAWWTGALLSGYMRGFKALPKTLKGKAQLRETLAIRTWALAAPESIGYWYDRAAEPLTWHMLSEHAVLQVRDCVLAQQKMSARGLWFELDLKNKRYAKAAVDLAHSLCPENIKQTLVMSEGIYSFHGKAHTLSDGDTSFFIVDEKVAIEITGAVTLSPVLEEEGFRDWLASGSIRNRLPRPIDHNSILQSERIGIVNDLEARPSLELRSPRDSEKSTEITCGKAAPSGLSIVDNFISPNEEAEIIKIIDSVPWSSALRRRVQHYGWRYDYKARAISLKDFLGPLPPWAEAIAQRLLDSGLVPELPDQVIVNEYLAQQGISKHIDCRECFKGPIVTISLLETWEMVFARSERGDDKKYKVLLPRFSATVMSGEAREKWTHEIAKKKTDEGRARFRRVSITFRKVVTKI